MNFGELSPRHIYPTLGVVCRPGCHYCRWSNHSLLSWRTLWYRFYYILILTYLIVFITDCFIRKWFAEWILIPSAFVVWAFGFYISLLDCWSVVWLVVFFLWLVGWSVLVGWLVGWFGFILVLVDCSLDRTTIISLLVFTEHKSSADHNGWQPGCKRTSQIWNVTHCLGALDRGQWTFTYDISQLLRKVICFHSWIDKLLIFPVILVWQLVEKTFYKLLSRSVPVHGLHLSWSCWSLNGYGIGVYDHWHKTCRSSHSYGLHSQYYVWWV